MLRHWELRYWVRHWALRFTRRHVKNLYIGHAALTFIAVTEKVFKNGTVYVVLTP